MSRGQIGGHHGIKTANGILRNCGRTQIFGKDSKKPKIIFMKEQIED